MSAGDRDTLTALLAEHKDRGYWKQSDVPGLASYVSACSCGSGDGHAYHLTEVVDKYVRAAQAQAWDEGWANAVADKSPRHPLNPYRSDAADQLKNPED